MTRRRALRTAAATLVALAAIAVGGTARGNATATSDCTPSVTRAAVASFVSAFNGGRYAQLDGLFARRPMFRWYSANVPGLRRGAEARNRASLTAYFRSRHLKRDRLRLVAFTFTGNANGLGNFVVKLKRSAVDFRGGASFRLEGKGAAVCAKPSPYVEQSVSFVVLSLGAPASAR